MRRDDLLILDSIHGQHFLSRFARSHAKLRHACRSTIPGRTRRIIGRRLMVLWRVHRCTSRSDMERIQSKNQARKFSQPPFALGLQRHPLSIVYLVRIDHPSFPSVLPFWLKLILHNRAVISKYHKWFPYAVAVILYWSWILGMARGLQVTSSVSYGQVCSNTFSRAPRASSPLSLVETHGKHVDFVCVLNDSPYSSDWPIMVASPTRFCQLRAVPTFCIPLGSPILLHWCER